MKIIFATGNQNKLREVREILPKHVEIVSLQEMGFVDDIEETGNTLEENSLLKAQTIFDIYQLPVLAEDTGLEVEALNGEPGVYSARYAGKHGNSIANMELLLQKLKLKSNRKAQFRTLATFIDENNTPHVFEGVVSGKISKEKYGEKGFGYDPIFVPEGYSTSFAQMSSDQKSKISHRARAIIQFVAFVEKKLK